MSDKELLELAAKAAGVEIKAVLGNTFWRPDGITWDPLTHDGDALRLAVDLSLDISGDCGKIYVSSLRNPWPEGILMAPDPYAATRRAIVRAAAEIGRCK